MRERTRGSGQREQGLEVFTRPWFAPQTPVTSWGWVYWKITNQWERMLDDNRNVYVQYRKGMRRKLMKAVVHDKFTCVSTSPASWVRTGTNSSAYVSACELISGHNEVRYPSDLAAAAFAKAVSKGKSVDYGHYNRWTQLKPSMRTRTNLAVFLAELRDIRRMWNILPTKHFSLDNWYNVIAYANGQHLNWNFGWRPFLNDVRKTFKAVDTFDARLNRFLNNADRELRKRFRDTPFPVKVTEYYTFQENPFWRNEFKWDFVEQHASAFDFIYQLPQYGRDEMEWRAWADSLGLHASPANLWAIIPWSFVIDWFVDVGGMLETTTIDWIQPAVELHTGCYSRYMTGEFEWNVKGLDAYGGVVLPGIKLNFSQYTRLLGLPNFSAATDDLDADKIRLGSSLLLSRLFR